MTPEPNKDFMMGTKVEADARLKESTISGLTATNS